MAYEQRDNSGVAFFVTQDKRKSEKSPAYNGDGMIGGVMGWLSLWPKKDKNGNTFLSWSWKPKEEQQAQPQQRQADPPINEEDIPF